jgi:hypothetical protein
MPGSSLSPHAEPHRPMNSAVPSHPATNPDRPRSPTVPTSPFSLLTPLAKLRGGSGLSKPHGPCEGAESQQVRQHQEPLIRQREP